jgi:hypothetical protein
MQKHFDFEDWHSGDESGYFEDCHNYLRTITGDKRCKLMRTN